MTREKPKAGQESVWDYPRPPRLEKSTRRVTVEFGGEVIAKTRRAYRVLETSHPPTWYIPLEDIRRELLVPADQRTFCEFKGTASYWTLRVGDRIANNAAWYYPYPNEAFAAIRNHVAFYPSHVDACYVDGERVQSQLGDFYGGWITPDVVGPFKGPAGTAHW